MAYSTAGDFRERLGNCAEGFDDSVLNALLDSATAFIDNVTGWWFEARSLVIRIDGRGSDTLLVPVPICSITAIDLVEEYFQPSTDEIELESVVIYNRHLADRLSHPDDRKNPKIAFVSANFYPGQTHLNTLSEWPEGHQNVQLTGVFGFTEYDPDAARSIATNAADAITAPDEITMANGAFTQEDVGKTVTIAGSASNDGSYTVATVVDSTNITVEEQTLTTEGDGFTADMSVAPQWGKTPTLIKDVCERIASRDMPTAPGTGIGGPSDPAWYERWMRSRGRVTQEKVRDQSISYAALGTGGGGGNDAGVITGDPYVDNILLMHSRTTIMRAV